MLTEERSLNLTEAVHAQAPYLHELMRIGHAQRFHRMNTIPFENTLHSWLKYVA